MSNKWVIVPSTNLQDLLDKSLYNFSIDIIPSGMMVPENFQNNIFWNDSTLSIPDSNGDPILATQVTSIEDKRKYYYLFNIANSIKFFSQGTKTAIYNWRGDAIQLLAQYILTTQGISVQTALDSSIHLLTTTEINLFSASNIKQLLYTVPINKTAIITEIILKDSDGSTALYGNINIGSDINVSDWGVGFTISAFTGSNNEIIRLYQDPQILLTSYPSESKIYVEINSVPMGTTSRIVNFDIMGYLI